MDLQQKIRTLPTQPGCYLYKNAAGEVIYVGKAKNLRARVRSYFLEASQANAKTGSLMREAVDVEYITVANEHEALALENNLIKQKKPRFNILLRDDKTYPYIKLTLSDRYPKVFVTRRLRKDGSAYYGPYFPGNLAYRLVDLIHRSFLIPSCKVDLSRYHPRACLQYYIKRCLGPCLEGLTTPESYRQTIRDVQLFLEGRPSELEQSLTERMEAAAEAEQFELAARLRDQIVTVHQMQDKQRMATTDNEDADVFGYHYENEMLAVNLFHMRSGKIVDRRDLFWEDLPESLLDIVTEAVAETDELEAIPRMEPDPAAPAPEIGEGGPVVQRSAVSELGAAFSPAAFFSALLKQIYLDQSYVPRSILVPVEFPDRALLAEILSERTGRRVEILAPQRGEKTFARRSGVPEREAVVRSAVSCAAARDESDSRGIARCAHTGRTASTDRVLRYLAHSGCGDCCLHGGVGGRRDEEVRLSQVPGEDRHRCRRLREHARGDPTPLQTSAGR